MWKQSTCISHKIATTFNRCRGLTGWMKRIILWSCVAAWWLAPSVALAQPSQFGGVQQISSIDLDDPNVSQGTAGLFEFGDAGMVITDVADCSYYHRNSNGTYVEYSGYQAIVQAVVDGMNGGNPAAATQGITPLDARDASDPYAKYFAIGYADNNYLGATSWDGITLSTTNNEVLLAETWLGDADLAGQVTIADYDIWKNSFTGATTIPDGWITGDFNSGIGYDRGLRYLEELVYRKRRRGTAELGQPCFPRAG